MAEEKREDVLQIPDDVGKLLDDYAKKLGSEYLFPVSRQQAFERFVRVMMAQGKDPHAG